MKPTVVVITLARRPDRLEAFHARWPAAGARTPVIVHLGVDTAGLAGCLASHLEVLSAYPGPLLILEDDACFTESFTTDVTPPTDWEIAWLGGEHRLPPKPAVNGWTRPRFLSRTHGYLVRNPTAVATLLRRVNATNISPHLARLPVTQYTQRPFTVGQCAGVSDIDGSSRTHDEFWNDSPLSRPR